MILAFAGCTFFSSGADWSDQVVPSGPCYAFNFVDGVVAGENAEVHAAFEGLNRQGMVEPLRAMDVALDAPTRAASDSQIPSLANTAGALHDHGLVDPTEEFLYDLAGTSALRSVLVAVPTLVDPDGRQAASEFPAQTLSLSSGTTTSQALVLLREGLNADPELSWLATAAYGVTDAAVARPALELLENDAVHGALWTRELTSVGPVPWLAQLYVGGTVDAPWDTLDLFLPFLGVSDA